MSLGAGAIKMKVVPSLVAAARKTTSQSLCTTTEGVQLLTPWLSSFAWRDSLVRLLHLNGSSAVHVEITCPELFRMFFGSKTLEVGPQGNKSARRMDQDTAAHIVSWYALQTCLMFAYAPVIEFLYANRTVAVESHRRTCIELSSSFSGTAYGFLSLPRSQFNDAYWESRSIVNRVTDLFLGDFVGANWRLSDARTVRLLSRNRIALSLLRHAVDVVSAWSTFYPERHSFIEIWKWASRNRVSEVFVRKRTESNASCCAREDGASALVPASSTEAGMCCGLFDELVATADWTALRWEDIDDHKDKESRPYVVQPFAWNVPFFAPGLDLPLKYGALGSLLASLVAANYYEFGDNLEYEMLVNTFAACLNATEMSLVSNRTWSASAGAVARILALKNASLESLWKAYRAAWEYLSGHGVSPSGFADVESDRLTDDRLFFVSWCLAVCGELGARELCNVPLQSGDTFASRNFTSVFRCGPRDPMSLPAKCAKS